MTSTTNLGIPEFNALFADLRDLEKHLADSGANRHDRACLLINACIAGGIVSGTNIVGVLVKLGFNRKHAGIALQAGVKRDPEWPDWGRRSDRTYYVPPEQLTDH